MVAVTVAIAGRNLAASTVQNRTRASAHTALVKCQTRTVIGEGRSVVVAGRLVRAARRFQNVADAVSVAVFLARSAAHANRVEHVSVTVTRPFRDVGATASANGTGTTTHTTLVQVSARPVVDVRFGVVVARVRIGASVGKAADEVA